MSSRVYHVGRRGLAHRQTNFVGTWDDISIYPTFPGYNGSLYDVMTDPNNPDKVIVVGDAMIDGPFYGIGLSSDAGQTWGAPLGSYRGTTKFNEVWWIDSSNIVAVGNNGRFVRSTNGGSNFSLISYATPSGLSTAGDAAAVHFTTVNNGVVGFEGFALKTTNGGSTWVVLNGGADLNTITPFGKVNAIYTSNDGLIVVICGSNAIVRSTDGGNTFLVVHNWIQGEGLHMTWAYKYDALHFWATGLGESRISSTNGGVTWTVLKATNLPGSPLPKSYAAHFHTFSSGYFSKNNELFLSANSGLTGAYQDTLFIGDPVPLYIYAVWAQVNPCYLLTPCDQDSQSIVTNDDLSEYIGQVIKLANSDTCYTVTLSDDCVNPVSVLLDIPNGPFVDCSNCTSCGCPDGYTTTDFIECIKVDTVAADYSGTTYLVGAGNTSVVYSNGGANFYDTTVGRPLPITQVATHLEDANSVTLAVAQTLQNIVWGFAGQTVADGRLNNVGVWTTVAPNPLNEWIGFSACIDIQVGGNYCIGIAADNRVRFKVNGVLTAELNVGNTFSFTKWHVLPITLQAGLNIIELEARNDGSSAAFGAEIYDATVTQLVNIATVIDLAAVTIFSTFDKIGDQFQTGESSGYNCPVGYALNTGDPTFTCSLIERAAYVPCCYLLIDCEGVATSILTSINLVDSLNKIVKIEGYTNCWIVTEADDCNGSVVVNVTDTFNTCNDCLAKCYLLTDCAGVETAFKVSTDLSSYNGLVIKIGLEATCWLVTETTICECLETITSTITSFSNCLACNPPKLPQISVPFVQPNFETLNCDPEEVIENNINFAEAVYKVVVQKKYGLKICCEYDFDSIVLAKEKTDLGELYDPTLCVTPCEEDCDTPCPVVEVVVISPTPISCPAPEDVTATIEETQGICDAPEQVVGWLLINP